TLFRSWSGTGPAATTFQQAIAESDLKTKWTHALQALENYVPTNGEITNLVRQGWVTHDDAIPLYANNGVDAALACLFLETAEYEKVAQDRDLTKGEILGMYQNELIT